MSLDTSVAVLKTRRDKSYEYRVEIVHAVENLWNNQYALIAFSRSPVLLTEDDMMHYAKSLLGLHPIEHGICIIEKYQDITWDDMKNDRSHWTR